MIGSETSTPDGYRQLSNLSVYFRLEGKQILDENGWTTDNGVSGGLAQIKTIFFPGVLFSDFPIVALSGDVGTFATVAGASGGVNITVSRMTTVPAIQVTCYLFSRRPPPDPGMGYALYNNGQIVYSILTPIVRPLGAFDNDGYSGVGLTGRTCAHIPQRRSQVTATSYTNGGLGSCLPDFQRPGYQMFVTNTWQATMIKCTGSSVSADVKSRSVGPISSQCTFTPQGFQGSTLAAVNYRSLIIDVTNF